MQFRLFGRDEKKEGRVPPDQSVTKGWPVLHEGSVPDFDSETWDFVVGGLVAEPLTLSYDEFMRLPVSTVRADVHCVTGWSKLDNVWKGVLARDVLAEVDVDPAAKHVMVHAENGYSANIPLGDFVSPNVLFAFEHNGAPLTPEHGWPLRLVLPKLYFWKSAKWVRGVELMAENRSGYWEKRGYHMYGDPFKSQRYWGS